MKPSWKSNLKEARENVVKAVLLFIVISNSLLVQIDIWTVKVFTIITVGAVYAGKKACEGKIQSAWEVPHGIDTNEEGQYISEFSFTG